MSHWRIFSPLAIEFPTKYGAWLNNNPTLPICFDRNEFLSNPSTSNYAAYHYQEVFSEGSAEMPVNDILDAMALL